MDQKQMNAQQLAEENARLKAVLDEVQKAIEPFLERRKPTQLRSFDQQLLHDLRNVLNELGLLRALVPGEESENKQ